jgi:hypothetical protein
VIGPSDLRPLVGDDLIDFGASATCPSCGATGLLAFFSARGIPSQSCVLLPDRSTALAYPTGDLVLGLCPRCGFITNIRFDPEKVDYGQPTEESQAFSPLFTEFARQLADDLVERYGLEGRTVLEVGSGKGDFLMLMAEFGIGRGIGIDPGFGRPPVGDAGHGSVELIRAFYGEVHTGLTGDLVITRHTMEHIAPVGDFFRLLRRSVEATDGATMFTEVPDTGRVLRELAFWDIYYEHCSYYTPGSLGRALREAGFTVTDIGLGFGDQYLLAHSVVGEAADPLPIEESPDEVGEMVLEFAAGAARHVAGWRQRLEGLAEGGKQVALWGGGSKAVAFLTTIGLDDEVAAVVDINPYKQGMFLPGTGHEVLAPETLTEIRPDLVVVMNQIYRAEITKQLTELGIAPEVVPV